jgi:two-component system, NtrC family, sensor kinase
MANLPGMAYRCRDNHERTLEFVSDGCFDLTGYTKGALINSAWVSFTALINPDDRELVQRQLREAAEDLRSYQLTYRIVTAYGDEKWVWERGSRSRHGLTDTGQFEGLLLDITENKLDEERRARLTTAVEQVAESIFITGLDGTIEYVNPAFEAITGYSLEYAIGKSPSFLKSGRHDEKYYRQLWDTLRRGEVWHGRFINKKKDDTLVELEASISPVRDAEGNVINFVAVERDETPMLELESQLRQAQKLEAVGSLAAGIAHEINTPIQFVGDNVRFLSDAFESLLRFIEKRVGSCPVIQGNSVEEGSCRGPRADLDLEFLGGEVPRAIEETLQGVERVATIVRAMKDFSHPDEREKVPIDINKALMTTLTVAHNELKYVADIETDLAANLPMVPCRPGSLNQVFLNLLVNAAHAIGEIVGDGRNGRGLIRVKTSGGAADVIIEISDTGVGIKKDIRDRVFETFFTTKEVGKGTGQGLAIARSVVVEQHGGTINFESEEGRGTTFRITLPLAPEEVPAH